MAKVQTLSLSFSPKRPRSALEQEQQRWLSDRDKLLENFTKSARQAHQDKLRHTCELIYLTNEFINALDRLGKSTRAQPDAAALRYAASSMFLRDCQRFLTNDDKEQFVYITGPVIEYVQVLDHIL